MILSQFISSLFDGVGQLLPGDFAGLLMSRPRLLAAWDSCCQKVVQRFSGSIQGVVCKEGPFLYVNLKTRFLEGQNRQHPTIVKQTVNPICLKKKIL